MVGSKNVLLVEDEPALRDLYQDTLTQGGFTVETASTAEEAYAKLRNYIPEYVCLDVMLPGKSGLEILHDLRSDPSLNCMQSKILILTNLAQRSVADNAMEHGADGYIIKADILPMELPEILASLDE